MTNIKTLVAMKGTAAVLIVVLGLGMLAMTGCSRSVEPSVSAQTVTRSAAVKKDGGPVYLCAGKTKKGESCRRHVKKQGDYCWMHLNQKPA